MTVKTFFTADHHFGHTNVIKYCNRPFANADEMNEELICRHNSVVGNNDIVYHIGDVAFIKRPETVLELLNRMNGRFHLVRGNHDHKMSKEIYSRFETVTDGLKEIKIRDADTIWGKPTKSIDVWGFQQIVLCHYPMLTWNACHYGSWQLHGHCHGTLPDDPNSRRIDVGVDCWDYYPASYEQIKEKMKLKIFKPIDQHGR